MNPFNSQGGGRQSTYGGGLGGIYQYGRANPYGPTIGMQRAGQSPGINPNAGAATGAATKESAARNYLTGTVQGQNTPFNEATRNSMYSQASGMNAAAEGAQNQRINETAAMGGASANDPSAQAARSQNMALRQGANQRAMGTIESQANLANQQAQSQAATTLLGSEDRNNALAQGHASQAQQAALSYLYGGGGASGGNGGNNFQGNGFLQYGPQYGSQMDRELDAQRARTQQMLRS